MEALMVGQLLELIGKAGQAQNRLSSIFSPEIARLLIDKQWDFSLNPDTILITFPLLLISISTIKTGMQVASWWTWELNGERVSRDLRKRVLDTYIGLTPFQRLTKGQNIDANLASTLTNDVKITREFIVHFFGGIPREVSKLLCFLILLLMLSPKALGFILLILAPGALLVKSLGKKLKRRSREALNQFGDTSEWIRKRMTGIETIKHYATEASELVSMERYFHNLTQGFRKAARTKAISTPIIEMFGIIGTALVLHQVLGQIIDGHTSSATGITFFAVLGFLGQSANQISRYYSHHKEASGAADRICELEIELERVGKSEDSFPSITPPTLMRDPLAQSPLLWTNQITFRYPDQSVDAVQKISLEFQAGHFYGIYGQTGSGKSTLLRLLMGVLPPSEGKVHRAVSRFSYLPQSLAPLPVSLLMNLTYPEKSQEDARAMIALEKAGALPILSSLANGLQTQLGPAGRTLSGGQWQRILLARLFYRHDPLIFIDEGTSALDSETEEMVLASLKAFASQGACVVAISHRPAAMKYLDEAIVLSKGSVAYQGSPKNLDIMKYL
jgi:ATP-binding cassette subfamily B protein